MPNYQSVSSTMSLSSRKFILYSFNLSGVLNFKYKNEKFETSTSLVIYNLVQAIILVCTSVFIFGNKTVFNQVFRSSIFDLDKFSNISQTVTIISCHFVIATSVSLTLLQIYKRKTFADFLNECKTLSIYVESLAKIERKAKVYCVLLIVYFAFMIVLQDVMFLKFTLASVAFNVATSYSDVVILSFLSFIKIFESFFNALLESCHESLKLHLQTQTSISDEMLRKCQKIYSLQRSFNDLFGVQLTILLSGNLFTLTFQVD